MNTVWKQLAVAATRDDQAFTFVCSPPASEEDLDQAEHILGVRFPFDLRAALSECDGMGETLVMAYDAGPAAWMLFPMLYSVERLLVTNQRWRDQLAESREAQPINLTTLLLFTDYGTGDYIAYDLTLASDEAPRIVFYDHETQSVRALAPSLEVFFHVWHSGRL